MPIPEPTLRLVPYQSREAAEYLSPGRPALGWMALTPPSTPLSRSSGRGEGGEGRCLNPRLRVPWAKLCRSSGAELCCQLLLQDTRCRASLVLLFATTLTYVTPSVVGVEPPHPPSFLGHPLPRGERVVGLMERWFQMFSLLSGGERVVASMEGRESKNVALSPSGRGWLAAGSFTSPSADGAG
jgi:hypothetical protein